MTTNHQPLLRERTRKWRDTKKTGVLGLALAGIAATAIGVVGGAPVAASPEAAPQAQPVVSGLQKETAITYNTSATKQAFAYCDAGQVVVGGGGWAYVPGSNDDPNRVTLWQLQPAIRLNGTSRQGFVAGASETSGGVRGAWWVEAYALCADPISGHHISDSPTRPFTSTAMQRADAFCGAGEKVLGTGARVLNTSFEVGLQVARVDAVGDIARAQAHEDASGYPFTWGLKSYAICADRPQGYEVRTGESVERGSESVKDASVGCSRADKQMISAGAAITNVAPGHVSLQVVYPRSSLQSMEAVAVENTPLFDTWDFIIARGVCVDEP
jgi:hypothetical protein